MNQFTLAAAVGVAMFLAGVAPLLVEDSPTLDRAREAREVKGVEMEFVAMGLVGIACAVIGGAIDS